MNPFNNTTKREDNHKGHRGRKVIFVLFASFVVNYFVLWPLKPGSPGVSE